MMPIVRKLLVGPGSLVRIEKGRFAGRTAPVDARLDFDEASWFRNVADWTNGRPLSID